LIVLDASGIERVSRRGQRQAHPASVSVNNGALEVI
jgi:hypothetical protein